LAIIFLALVIFINMLYRSESWVKNSEVQRRWDEPWVCPSKNPSSMHHPSLLLFNTPYSPLLILLSLPLFILSPYIFPLVTFPSTHTITWKNVHESFKNIAIVEITPSFSSVGSAQRGSEICAE
jgi:hypothetical protein